MDQETKEIISKQTGVTDMILIEKTFFECQQDSGATILTLLEVPFKQKRKLPDTKFDEIRCILDEKATIYTKKTKKTI